MTPKGYRFALIGLGLAAAASPAHAQIQGPRSVSFTRDVLPLFQKRCTICHGVDQKSGLKLDTYDAAIEGGLKGGDIVKGKPDESRLIQMVEGRVQPKMPPSGAPLTRAEISLLRQWILQGAKDDGSPDAPSGRAEKALQILSPKEGSTVREKVKVIVPRSSIPPEGFVAIYIDNLFKGAIAPPSEDETRERKLPPDSPVTYVWDTQSALSDDTTLPQDQRFAGDGPHILTIRSYNSDGVETERKSVRVNLKNRIDAASNQPVQLWYGGQVGEQFTIQQEVSLEASAAEAGARTPAGASVGGPRELTHNETTRYLASLEDMNPGNGVGFWRERRLSPITVLVNNLKQVVRSDASSRYYAMDRRGRAQLSKVMERENRIPILNPIEVPGRAQRINVPFETDIHINLGAYIPAALQVRRVQAIADGIEWQYGEPCARIVATYQTGSSTISINSLNIQDAKLDVDRGITTVWLSQKTHRVLKVKHELTGTLEVDASRVPGGGAGAGTAGGEFGPGMMGGPPGGMMGGPPGGMMGGPGGMMGGPPGGYGGMMRGGGPGGGMMGGPPPGMMGGPGMAMRGGPGAAGMRSGAPPGMGMRGGPGGGMMSGGPPPGMMSGGPPPGMMGGPGGMMGGPAGMGMRGGGGAAGLAPTTRRLHVELKITAGLAQNTAER